MVRPKLVAHQRLSSGRLVRKTRLRLASLVVAIGIVSASCSSDPGALPEVPDFKPARTTTTDVDYSLIDLKGVPGRSATSAVPFGPGRATLSGVVVSEEGAVGTATVIVERIVNGAVAKTTVFSAEDGTWTMPSVFGGRYRVRAFRQPNLAQTTPSAVFLGESETKQVELRVKTIDGLNVSVSFAPDPPQITRDTQLAVRVTQKTVDVDGVVRSQPLTNERVDLIGSSSWRVESSNPAFTDSEGKATWLLRCRQTGRNPLAVTVFTQSIPLTVNDCVDSTVEETTTSEGTESTTDDD